MIKKFSLSTLAVSFIAIVILIFTTLYLVEENRKYNLMVTLALEERGVIENLSDNIYARFDTCLSDLTFLRDTVNHAIEDGDPESLANVFLNFSRSKIKYDQIRYISNKGDEVVRVNYNAGRPLIVKNEDLQNKADRYYIQRATTLAYDAIYVSQLDLNVENGQLEIPHKPMIRIITPVKDQMGYIVLNFKADSIIAEVDEINVYSKGKIFLLNSHGDFLYSNKIYKDFAFMYGESDTFKDRFSQAWTRLSNKGQITTDKGLFTYSNLISEFDKHQYNLVLDDREFWLVSHINKDHKLYRDPNTSYIKRFKNIIRHNYAFIMIAVLISLLISFMKKKNDNNFKEIKWESEHDTMTRILNRHAGIKKINDLLDRNLAFTLIYFDIDGLKWVNDNFGHDQGDYLINSFVHIVQSVIRSNDIFARFGGDEFILVIDNTSQEVISRILDKIYRTRDEFVVIKNLDYDIDFSYGTALALENNHNDCHELIKQADKSMYINKKSKL